jgi:hypothetical protein
MIKSGKLNSKDSRVPLIDHVRSYVNWRSFRQKFIQTREDLAQVSDCKVGLQPFGKNWIMVFTRSNDKYNSYFIERRMVYGGEGEVIAFRLRANRNIYDGTILEGTMVYDKANQRQVFIITDVFNLCGESQLKEPWSVRMEVLGRYVERNVVPNISSFDIVVESSHDMSELRTLVSHIDKLNWDIRGLVFYSEKTGTKWVFDKNNGKSAMGAKTILDADEISDDDNSSDDSSDDSSDSDSEEEKITATMEVRTTTLNDVYELWVKNKNNNDMVKHGIAYIPNTAKSQQCSDLFKDAKKARLNLECTFSMDRQKWIPLAKSRKKPINITELLKLEKKPEKKTDKKRVHFNSKLASYSDAKKSDSDTDNDSDSE